MTVSQSSYPSFYSIDWTQYSKSPNLHQKVDRIAIIARLIRNPSIIQVLYSIPIALASICKNIGSSLDNKRGICCLRNHLQCLLDFDGWLMGGI